MASILIRGLDDPVKELLRERAAGSGRSMEAEARDILTRALQPPNLALAFLRAGERSGGADLPLRSRTDMVGDRRLAFVDDACRDDETAPAAAGCTEDNGRGSGEADR